MAELDEMEESLIDEDILSAPTVNLGAAAIKRTACLFFVLV